MAANPKTIPIQITDEDGILTIAAVGIPKTAIIGSQYDHKMQKLVFTRPAGFEALPLFVYFKDGHNQRHTAEVGLANEYAIINALTQTTSIQIQIAFLDGDELRAGANVLDFKLRASIGGGSVPTALPIPEGQKGPKGDKGDKGDDGAPGSPGAKGEKGDKGDKGDTGSQGPKGDAGPKGDTGSPGAKGDTGSQGPKGDTGDTDHANKADKLTTPRTLSLTGAATGSMSFDGSANASAELKRRNAMVLRTSGAETWAKAAEVTSPNGGDLTRLALLVTETVGGVPDRQGGILNIRWFPGQNQLTAIEWITGNLDPAAFELVYNAATLKAELWVNLQPYQGFNFTVFDEGSGAYYESAVVWTLYKNTAPVAAPTAGFTRLVSTSRYMGEVYNLGLGKNIPDYADLNSYTAPGVYACVTNRTTLLNYPPGMTHGGFKLIVERIPHDPYRLQTIKLYDGVIYVRGYTGSAWAPWRIFVGATY